MKTRLPFRIPIQTQERGDPQGNGESFLLSEHINPTLHFMGHPSSQPWWSIKGETVPRRQTLFPGTCGRTAVLKLRSSVRACLSIAGRRQNCVYFCFLLSSGVLWNSACRKAQLGIHWKQIFWIPSTPNSLAPKAFSTAQEVQGY